MGQLAGDALGSMVEGSSATEIRHWYPSGLRRIAGSKVWNTLPGQPTDDSEMALALGRTLAHRVHFDAEEIAESYMDWLDSEPFDKGGTITRALRAMQPARKEGKSLREAALAGGKIESEANGALMRQSPLAIWGFLMGPSLLDEYVRTDTALTHPNRVCQDASAAFIVATSAAIRECLDAEQTYRFAVEWDQKHGASPTVTAALAAARHSHPRVYTGSNIGHVLIALQNAFYYALHADSFESGIVATVMHGGDTDTNAAIAGALLGAIHRIGAVPEQWSGAVLSCRPASDVPGVVHPRPPAYWPVDAMELVHELMAAGNEAAVEAAEARGSFHHVARRDMCTIEPMSPQRERLAFSGQYTPDEYKRIKRGHIPPEQVDKWFIFHEGDTLWCHRSWTGYCIYSVRFEVDHAGHRVAEAWVTRDSAVYSNTDTKYDVNQLLDLVDGLLVGRRDVGA